MRIHGSPIAGTYNVFNFTDKLFETHPGTSLSPDLFKACFALPIWFPAVETGGKTYIDGVYWKDANLREAVARGADEIWVIWTVSEIARLPARAVRPVLPHHRGDRRRPVLRGAGRDRGDQRRGPGRDGHRAPRDPGPRHPSRDAGAARLPAVLLGRRHEPDRRHGRPRRPGVPRRAGRPVRADGPLAPPIGMRFVEEMRGDWAMGETDPRTGAERGQARRVDPRRPPRDHDRRPRRVPRRPEARRASRRATSSARRSAAGCASATACSTCSIRSAPAARQMRYTLPFTRAGRRAVPVRRGQGGARRGRASMPGRTRPRCSPRSIAAIRRTGRSSAAACCT